MDSSLLKPSLRLRTSKISLKPSSGGFGDKASTTTTTLVPLLSSPTTPNTTLTSPVSIESYSEVGNIGSLGVGHTSSAGVIGIHRGAIDNTTITSGPPKQVMTKVRSVLDSIGICVQPESTFRYRCIRPSQSIGGGSEPLPGGLNHLPPATENLVNTNTIYANDPSRDPAGEVRFSVELTRIAGLNDTYCLDIRRLKGNLRSYQFLYETIRDRAQLTT